MSSLIQTAVPNSLVLVLDPDTGELPTSLDGRSIAASSTCVAVGAVSEFDGETTVCIGVPSELPRNEGLVLRWEGRLGTSGRIGILNIYNEVLLEVPAPEAACVAIWTNDPDEPDKIWVLVS